MTLLLGEPSPGFLVAVMTPYTKGSSTKSASKARRSSPIYWEGYHRLIPDDQLFTGKDLTVPIEQDNSNILSDAVRYSFIVVDFHHLGPAGLPAHLTSFVPQLQWHNRCPPFTASRGC